MEVKITVKDFRRSLGVVKRVKTSKCTLELVRGAVQMKVKDSGGLYLTATNLILSITDRAGGKPESEGAAVVDLKELQTALKPFKATDLITITKGEKNVVITNGTITAVILQSSDVLFSEPPNCPIVGGHFRNWGNVVSKVVQAIATDDSRPVLTGAELFPVGNYEVKASGADGFKLCVGIITGSKGEDWDKPVIIPRETIQVTAKWEDATIHFMKDWKFVRMHYGTTTIVSSVIQGSFPDLSQLLGSAYTSEIIVNTDDLARAVNGSQVEIVRLASIGNSLHVFNIEERGDEFVGVTYRASIPAVGDIRIVVNKKLFLDALKTVERKQVTLKTTKVSQPMEFDDFNARHIIMPMYVNWEGFDKYLKQIES